MRPSAQHIGAAAPGVHAAASATVHPAVGVWHVPATHEKPAQQSPPVAQLCPELLHAHRPDWQSICPQHSSDPMHPPPASRQHTGVTGAPRHDSPSQHADAAPHPCCEGRHVAVAVSQRPDRHRSPA